MTGPATVRRNENRTNDASKSYVRMQRESWWSRCDDNAASTSTWGRILRNGREFIANCWSTFRENSAVENTAVGS